MSKRVEYSHNNSGGRWWLKDKHWAALEKAGWEVEWGGSDFCHSNFGAFLSSENKAPNTCEDGKCEGHRRYGSYDEAKAAGEGGRWLGCLAKAAVKDFDSLADAVREWEQVTGMDASDEGCNCCGAPHSFSTDGEYASGDDIVALLYPTASGKSLRQLAEERAK